VSRECSYQFRIHKREFSKYKFTQKEIHDPFRDDWMNLHYPKSDFEKVGGFG
jgi:hypothetical protein